jgi:V/A-type H+-transporting ATPase subunit K
MNARFKVAAGMTAIAAVLAGVTTLLWWALPAVAAEATAKVAVAPEALGWGLVGAAVATGLAAVGAGIAVANVGTAAIGAIAEKPELFGRLLILVGLAEGIAIYGLIVSILILNRLA